MTDVTTPVWDRPWPTEGLEAAPACPVCGGTERALLFDGLMDLAFSTAPGRWTLWRCNACASAWLDPRPDPAHIGQAYGSYYTHEGTAPAEPPLRPGLIGRMRRALFHDWLNHRFGTSRPALFGGRWIVPLAGGQARAVEHNFRHLPRLPHGGGALLDVGCGNGAFLHLARGLGWQVHGVDPDPAAVSAARAMGLSVEQGGIEALDGQASRFDAITLNHVIEHVHNPREVVAACLRLLRPGGQITIETPNAGAAGLQYFGPAWRGLEPPRHLQLFSHQGLHAMLCEAGFTDTADRDGGDPWLWLAGVSEDLAKQGGIALPAEPAPDRANAMRQPGTREFLTVTARRAG